MDSLEDYEDWEWVAAHTTKWLVEQGRRERQEHKARARQRQHSKKDAAQAHKSDERRKNHQRRCHIRSEANERREVCREEARLHWIWEEERSGAPLLPEGLSTESSGAAVALHTNSSKEEVEDAAETDALSTEGLGREIVAPPSFPPPTQAEHQEEVWDKAQWEEVLRDSVQAVLNGGTSERKRRLVDLEEAGWIDILTRRGYELPAIQKRLGRGTYGTVERVRSTQSPFKLFALKRQFLGDFAHDAKVVLREITILNTLKGARSIVQIQDAFLARPNQRDMAAEIWVVMEHFPHNLYAVRLHFKEEEMTKHLVFKVLQGLHVLHSADIIHRDLKPENILVDLGENPPQTLQVGICDFGQSRSIHNVPEDCTLSNQRNTGDIAIPAMPTLSREVSVRVTSCWWRAPEMWGFADTSRIARKQLKALDLFSLGLIWAELFTGEPVLTTLDGDDPAQLRLLEILQKVDRPDGKDECKELGFKDDVSAFVESVIVGNLEAVREALEEDASWKANVKQKNLLKLPYIGICDWLSCHALALDEHSLVHEIIRDATRFSYRERPTVEELMENKYFVGLHDSTAFEMPWTSAQAPHFDDIRAVLEGEFKKQKIARRNSSGESFAAENAQVNAMESVARVNEMVREQIDQAHQTR